MKFLRARLDRAHHSTHIKIKRESLKKGPIMIREALKLKISFNHYLNDYIKHHYSNKDILSKACRYSLESGGKRIRPILCLLINQTHQSSLDKVLPLALALEMVHTYSLIHDDLPILDDDHQRRGLPTNHIKFGEDIALLAGDALLSDLWSLIAKGFSLSLQEKSAETYLDDSQRLKAIAILSDAIGSKGMVYGQVLDIKETGKEMGDLQLVYRIHQDKTAKLIAAACSLGAISAGLNHEEVNSYYLFGKYIGLAFQFKDDLLDKNQKTGKTPGKDLAQNKMTCLKFISEKECEKKIYDLTDKALKELTTIKLENTVLKNYVYQLTHRLH